MKRAIGLLAPFAAVFVLIAIAMCAVACASLGGEPAPAVEAGAQAAGGIATALTGNPAIGLAVSTLVGAVGGWFVGRKPRKAAPA